MSDHAISALKKKRSELAGELERVKSDLRAIDRALLVFGFEDIESIEPRRKPVRARLFRSGELVALIGEAERAGLESNADIAAWIVERRGWDQVRLKRVHQSVKDRRKPSAN